MMCYLLSSSNCPPDDDPERCRADGNSVDNSDVCVDMDPRDQKPRRYRTPPNVVWTCAEDPLYFPSQIPVASQSSCLPSGRIKMPAAVSSEAGTSVASLGMLWKLCRYLSQKLAAVEYNSIGRNRQNTNTDFHTSHH